MHVCEAACHFETCEGETCCVCVTRRLVATGGGKQADLYSFDHPGGRGWAEGVSKKVRRREMEGKKLSLFQDKKCVLLSTSVCMLTDICICAHFSSHPLPQLAVQCPVCRHC